MLCFCLFVVFCWFVCWFVYLAKQLCLISGVTDFIAVKIIEQYPTYRSLYNAYNGCGSTEDKKLLISKTVIISPIDRYIDVDASLASLANDDDDGNIVYTIDDQLLQVAKMIGNTEFFHKDVFKGNKSKSVNNDISLNGISHNLSATIYESLMKRY